MDSKYLKNLLSLASILIIVFSMAFLVSLSPANAAIRDTITYQGQVVDSSLIPPTNGSYNMQFRVYDSLAAGNLLWTESYTGGNQVTINNGVFTVELNSVCASWTGGCASNGGIDWTTDSYYLQVEFDADSNATYEEIFAPRKRFTSVPYAQVAAQLNTAADIDFNNDADHSIQWDQATDKTLTVENDDATAVANLSVEGQAQVGNFVAPPTALGNGSMYYNTTTNLFYVYQNGAWVSIGAGGGGGDAIWDADTDTGIQVEKLNDDDTIRFDLGGASPIVNALVLDQTDGFVWNDGSDVLDFRIEGDNEANLFFVDSANDRVGIGTNSPAYALDVIGGVQVGDGTHTDQVLMEFDTGHASPVGNWELEYITKNYDYPGVWDALAFDLPSNENSMFQISGDKDLYNILRTRTNSEILQYSLMKNSSDDNTTNAIQAILELQGDQDIALQYKYGGSAAIDAMLIDTDGASNAINSVIFNNGENDTDFRVAGDAETNLLFVDASADKIGLGTNAPNAFLEISSTGADALRLNPYGAAAGNTANLEFMELAGNGTDYVGFKSPDSLAASVVWTLPNADGNNGEVLSTDSSGNLSWLAVGDGDAIWDADTDTGIQVEEGSDDDTIRFDLGTTATDALLLTQATGFVWNDAGLSTLDFRLEGDTDANLFMLDASGDNIGIGELSPDANAKLEVAGNIMMDDYLYFQNTTTDYMRFDGSDFIFTNDLLPSASATYNLGSSTARWKKAFLGGNSLHIGDDGNDSDISYDNVNNNLVFNDGAESIGIRMEGSSSENLFYLDAVDNRIGLGTSTPNAFLEISSNIANALRLNPYGAVAGNTANLEFMELAANGSDYVGFKSPDSLVASIVWTLPNLDGGNGSMLMTDGAGGLSWGNSLKSLWDADTDTGIQVEEGADDDTIRFDLGITATDALLLTQATGLVWNEAGLSTLDFRLEGDTDANLFFLDASGDNIGIGEAAPDINAKLEVAGNFMLDDYVYFNNVTTDYLRHDGTTFVMSDDFLASTDDTYDFGTSTVRWNDQYLGGTLSLGANADDYDIHFDETNNMLVLNDIGDADGLRIEGDGHENLLLVDAVNDRVGLGINTTALFDNRLVVENNVDDGVLRLLGPDDATYHYGARLRFGDADYVYIDEYADDNLMVHADGNLYLDSTNGQVYIPSAYNNDLGNVRDLYVAADGEVGYRSSSIRYKENVLNMESIDWLYDLRPVNYAYKDKIKEVYNKETGLMEEVIIPSDKSKQYGLIAEEVDLINKDIVSYNEDGSVETVNYSILMTPLLRAIQIQKGIIDDYQEKVILTENGVDIAGYFAVNNENDEEVFHVDEDGVAKVYSGNQAPDRDEDGEFGFAKAGNKGRLYFRTADKDYYINSSGTGDYSEYMDTNDSSLWEDWGTLVVLSSDGLGSVINRSSFRKDKSIIGVVSEFGTRNNDNENGSRHEDPSYVNIAMLGQVPVKVTNQNGPIAIGDYLASSDVPGHAMKADIGDPVIGIAMNGFLGTADSSEGMIQILLARNNNGNISALLADLQEKRSVTAEDVVSALNSENLAVNYLLMTKGEVMEGLKVHGELQLDNQNIGKATLTAGQTEIVVNFPARFIGSPIVTVSPYLDGDNILFFDFQYVLTDITESGFKIILNQALDYNLHFNWQAFVRADYTNEFSTTVQTQVIEPVVQEPVLVSVDCRADNLSACVTAHGCWEFSEIATWTGETCVLK